MINICVFEDDGYQQLLPLTYIRPAYELLLGIDSLFEKIHRHFSYANITLHCRDYLKPLVKLRYPGFLVNSVNSGSACLFINGRVVLDKELFETLAANDNQYDLLFTYQGNVVAAYLREKCLDYMRTALESPPSSAQLIRYLRPKCVSKELENVKMVNNLWDTFLMNPDTIVSDFSFKNLPGIIKGDVHSLASIYNENNVFIGRGTCVEDFVVINAKNGPVYIEEDVYIEAGSYIEGPAFIGKHSRIQGARIKRSSIGEHCKIGGEVSASVFFRYSNKAHSGFLGHTYVGEWVNMGADTTTSNLKNTYGNVRINNGVQEMDSGQTFFGSIMADHVKTGIGTLLNTGTVIGFGANIFGVGSHPKYVPSFSWGSNGRYEPSYLNKFFEIAERMMERRKKELREVEKEAIATLYTVISAQKVG